LLRNIHCIFQYLAILAVMYCMGKCQKILMPVCSLTQEHPADATHFHETFALHHGYAVYDRFNKLGFLRDGLVALPENFPLCISSQYLISENDLVPWMRTQSTLLE